MPNHAIVAGASGLVGGFLLRRLAAAGPVTVLVRRHLDGAPAGVIQKEVDFVRLDPAELPAGADLFCALGTTIRKAGSQEAFRRVDFDYPLAFARAGRQCGAKRFFLVSSVDASPNSPNFYLRVKGELEVALAGIGFEALHLFRPSMLLGPRTESRPGENIGKAVIAAAGFLLQGPLAKYRAIEADTVAAAMAAAALGAERGVIRHHYVEMARSKA